MDMTDFMASMGLTAAEMKRLEEAFDSIDVSPKGELLHRLNLRVQGVDPGPSVNWKGDRGFAIY